MGNIIPSYQSIRPLESRNGLTLHFLIHGTRNKTNRCMLHHFFFRPGRSDSPVKRVSRFNHDGRSVFTFPDYKDLPKQKRDLKIRILNKKGSQHKDFLKTDASHGVGRCPRALSLSPTPPLPPLPKQPNEV